MPDQKMETRAAQKKADTAPETETTETVKQIREREKKLLEENERLKAAHNRLIQEQPSLNQLVSHMNTLTAEMKNLRAENVRITSQLSVPPSSGFSEISTPRKTMPGSPADETVIHVDSEIPPRPSSVNELRGMFDMPIAPMSDFSLKEAVSSLPTYDGENMSVYQFIRAVKRARALVPGHAEAQFVPHAVNKLRGLARDTIDDDFFYSIDEFCDTLKVSFGSKRNYYEYLGELTAIFRQKDEHITKYIIRVKDLRTAVLNSKRIEHGEVSPSETAEIDRLTSKSFIDGLPYMLRKEMGEYRNLSLPELFAKSRRIYADFEEECRKHGNQTTASVSRNTISRDKNTSSDNRPRDKCNNCGRTGHTANKCWLNKTAPRNQNGSSSQNNYAPPKNSKTCAYCKNLGHDISECRKKRHNEQIRNNQGNGQASSRQSGANRETPLATTRPVHVVEVESNGGSH